MKKLRYHKYDAIRTSNAHTVANLLKQFFKKLRTDLIPIDVMEFLIVEIGEILLALTVVQCFLFSSQNVFSFTKGRESPSMEILREELSMLDPMRRDTLRFLLRHLYL